MSIMKFDEWIRSVCFQAPPPECEELARSAWNAAIDAAVKEVSIRFDELEPWIEPEDIEKLKAEPPEDM